MKVANKLVVKQERDVVEKRHHMYINVILTFDTPDTNGECQEFFDLHLPISKKEISAVDFLNKKLFKKIAKKCNLYKRQVGDLTKISTAGDWDLFEKLTNLEALPDLGHSCKWFFGNGRSDLDAWEQGLIDAFGFGANVDMSYLTAEWIANTKAHIEAARNAAIEKLIDSQEAIAIESN